jgi:hypothetical protein
MGIPSKDTTMIWEFPSLYDFYNGNSQQGYYYNLGIPKPLIFL